jgi:hypothetical protein
MSPGSQDIVRGIFVLVVSVAVGATGLSLGLNRRLSSRMIRNQEDFRGRFGLRWRDPESDRQGLRAAGYGAIIMGLVGVTIGIGILVHGSGAGR